MKKTIIILSALILLTGFRPFERTRAYKEKNEPTQSIGSVNNEIGVKKDWVMHASHGSKNLYVLFKPAANEDSLYVTDQRGDVSAIARKTAKFSWRANIGKTIVTSPVYGDNKIFFATDDATLYAVAAENGKTLWHVSLPNDVFSAPSYGTDMVVIKTTDGQVLAFSSKDGELMWTYKEKVPQLVLRQNNPPKVEYPYVLVGFANGKLVALSAKDGRLAWEQTIARPTGFSEIKRMTDVTGEIDVDNGVAFVTSYHGNVAAIQIQGGRALWTKEISSYSGLAVNYHHVFVTDSSGRIWALNRNTGDVVWRQNDLIDRQLTAPTVIDDFVVVADSEGKIYWMSDKDGHFVAREYLSKSGIVVSPLAYGGKLYAISRNGTMISLTPGKTEIN